MSSSFFANAAQQARCPYCRVALYSGPHGEACPWEAEQADLMRPAKPNYEGAQNAYLPHVGVNNPEDLRIEEQIATHKRVARSPFARLRKFFGLA